MTREEALRIFRKEIECLSHTKCEDCILKKDCDPMITTPSDSEYIEAYSMAIKALEQEPILNKIRAEIDKARFIDKDTRICKNALASGLEVAMEIIDKYKSESEDI